MPSPLATALRRATPAGSRKRSRINLPQSGFTLVELLVVIGIIALLLGILVPSLTKARKSAQSAADMVNLRSIAQGAALYATNNKGSTPYGFIGAVPAPGLTGDAALGSMAGNFQTASYYAYFSLISNVMNPTRQAASNDGRNESGSWTRFKYNFDAVWRSPGVQADGIFPIHYAANTSLFLHMPAEVKAPGFPGVDANGNPVVNRVLRSRQMADAFSDTALFWGAPTSISPTAVAPTDVASIDRSGGPAFGSASFGNFYAANTGGGPFPNSIPITLIDNQRPCSIESFRNTSYRFYFKNGRGAAAYVNNPVQNYGQSIFIPVDEEVRVRYPNAATSYNAEIGGSSFIPEQVGGMRFRFGKDDIGNVAMGDTSVQTFRLNKKSTYAGAISVWTKSYQSDFKRQRLLSKPPAGFAETVSE
jgi:prepilin-type N-terminal cleavage/methylation domain-containing protein